MTRLPTESWDVKAITGELFPKYKVKSLCSHPKCSRFTDHAHHIARRSFIIGDIAWVQYEDGPIVGNLAGLCYLHHDLITNNQAAILWEKRLNQYTWCDVNTNGELVAVDALYPHPPLHTQAIKEKERTAAHIHGPGDDALCPECRRPLKRTKETGEKSEAPKRRKTWSITVPDETAEDGAVVLDTLVSECAKLFGREDGGKLRYYVVAQALALVVQNGHLLSD